MHDLKTIFICSKHGEVDGRWHEEPAGNDDWIGYYMCTVPCCTNEVTPKLGESGSVCYRQMSPGELEWEYFEKPDFEDYYGYG